MLLFNNGGGYKTALMETFDKVWKEKFTFNMCVYVGIPSCFVFPNSRVLTTIGFVVSDFKFSLLRGKKSIKLCTELVSREC
jgi:hypothetical protein